MRLHVHKGFPNNPTSSYINPPSTLHQPYIMEKVEMKQPQHDFEELQIQQERKLFVDFGVIKIAHPEYADKLKSMTIRLDAIETITYAPHPVGTDSNGYIITMKSGQTILAAELGDLEGLTDGW